MSPPLALPHLNRVATAVPEHDVHLAFLGFARTLLEDDRARLVFDRMAERSGIAHRYSNFRPGSLEAGEVDADGFYRRGAFPSTGARMRLYEPFARTLALEAIGRLGLEGETDRITHVVVASCTGFTAPGLDLQIADRLGLKATVGRTMVGFMGCSAAVPALRLAYDTVRADPRARVLMVNCELSTLHLQETSDLETVLSFMLFADGASAALITADPVGLALEDFRSEIVPDSAGLITWRIGDQGFDMHLSGKVPGRIAGALRGDGEQPCSLLRGLPAGAYDLWAVHAGGRTVLDAVEVGLELDPTRLRHSRAVLHEYGNMSSATVMFVLARILAGQDGSRGIGMAFGPGMVAESFRFRRAG
ncbi:type III polyketide synthase [Lichenicoccus roseus]|uniref:Type III polyketide synthase n=1 Tax=Lichenicoccus roseus TaxID=2683649 RepID=A0A5R9JD26_9PROT|nr:type III polyketide synthase [Lichenicoccus roseus]TLU72188.1 type III polyketide synthase [Lichenicoccus roseus]